MLPYMMQITNLSIQEFNKLPLACRASERNDRLFQSSSNCFVLLWFKVKSRREDDLFSVLVSTFTSIDGTICRYSLGDLNPKI